MTQDDPSQLFSVFNEIGIIEQLSRTILEAHLPNGLIAPHFTVLNHLIRVQDGRRPMDMARAFQVPKTSLTHTLAGLERLGLVEMRPNPEDGRSKCVWLTEKGRALRDQTIADMAPEFKRLASGIDIEKLVSILPVLIELRQFLDKARDTDASGGVRAVGQRADKVENI